MLGYTELCYTEIEKRQLLFIYLHEMKRFKLVAIFLLSSLFIGGTFFLFWKSQKLLKQDSKQSSHHSVSVVIPSNDHGLLAFDAIIKNTPRLSNAGKARRSLLDFLVTYPKSPKIVDVKKMLGDLNIDELFSVASSVDKISYTVMPRDSLSRIAAKFKTSAELVFKVNNLTSPNLQIGQQLIVPRLETSILIDSQSRTLTILNQGQFFKEYPIASLQVRSNRRGVLQTKVVEKLALHGGRYVPFWEKNYSSCARSVILSQPGLMIRSTPENNTAVPLSGILVSAPDIKEMFMLIHRDTVVMIR